MLVLVILAGVWAAVLLPPFLRGRRENRPDNSVVSFRAHLSTLERATPGTSLRPGDTGQLPAVTLSSAPRTTADVRRRRREVLVGLIGATAFSLLLVVVTSGAFVTVMFLASAGCLGAYVFALRQIHLRTRERAMKVRPLVPRTAEPTPALDLRHSAAH